MNNPDRQNGYGPDEAPEYRERPQQQNESFGGQEGYDRPHQEQYNDRQPYNAPRDERYQDYQAYDEPVSDNRSPYEGAQPENRPPYPQGQYTDEGYPARENYEEREYPGPRNDRPYDGPDAPYRADTAQREDAYSKGPQQPKREVNEELNSIVRENVSWLKAFFSPDYTESVALAKNSNVQFAWALVFVVHFILFPLSQLFLLNRYTVGIGANAGIWAFGLLQSVLNFGILAGVLLLSQVIFKEFRDWWRPLNAAAVCMIPRTIILPLNILFGLLGVGIFNELNAILVIVAGIMTIILMLRFMQHNKEKRAAVWIFTALVTLYFVLLSGILRIG